MTRSPPCTGPTTRPEPRVATTASYQASVPGFVAGGLERIEAEPLIRRSVTIARDVRDRMSEDGTARWVAASVGPYGAVLADGSEYRGRYGLSRAELRDFHLPRMELLASAGPDFMAVETIPDVDEAEVLVELLDDLGVAAWFSFSATGSHTRAGQPLTDAFAVAGSAEQVFAVGVNCCAPSDVLDAVRLAVEVTGKPAVAYPNSGETWDAPSRRWAGDAAYDVSLVPSGSKPVRRTSAAAAAWARRPSRPWQSGAAARLLGCVSHEIRRLLLGTFVRPQEETGTGRPRVEAVYGYLVRHDRGLVLLDTGLGQGDAETEDWYRPQRRRARRGAPRARGCPGRHRGRGELPPALRPLRRQPVAGRPAGHVPARGARGRASRELHDGAPGRLPGQRYDLLDGEAEILPGVHVIPTPGHVDGHQSVVVECEDGSVVLAGQSHDTASAWSADVLANAAPGLGHVDPLPVSPDWMARLLAFDPKRVVFAHDAAVWEPD